MVALLVYVVCGILLLTAVYSLTRGTACLAWSMLPQWAPYLPPQGRWALIHLGWAFFVKASLDQPLHAIAHDPVSGTVPPTTPSAVLAMSWSAWAAHLWLFALDALLLAWALGMVTVMGLVLRSSPNPTVPVLSLLIRLAILTGLAWAHTKLSPDSFPVSVAVIMLAAWAMQLSARTELRRANRREVQYQLSKVGLMLTERHAVTNRRKAKVSWFLMQLVAGVVAGVAWWSDNLLKFLASGIVILIFVVVAGISDIISDVTTERSDRMYDTLRPD